jgi:hypothetical protein
VELLEDDDDGEEDGYVIEQTQILRCPILISQLIIY